MKIYSKTYLDKLERAKKKRKKEKKLALEKHLQGFDKPINNSRATKSLYKHLAKKYNLTEARVERIVTNFYNHVKYHISKKNKKIHFNYFVISLKKKR